MRGEHITSLESALKAYYAANKSYPPLFDNPADDLAKAFVGGGFLSAIPQDPSPGMQYRYASDGLKSFGLLVRFESGAPGIPPGGRYVG